MPLRPNDATTQRPNVLTPQRSNARRPNARTPRYSNALAFAAPSWWHSFLLITSVHGHGIDRHDFKLLIFPSVRFKKQNVSQEIPRRTKIGSVTGNFGHMLGTENEKERKRGEEGSRENPFNEPDEIALEELQLEMLILSERLDFEGRDASGLETC